jgi:hypothetical protein
LQCGFVRSNFCLAMAYSLLPLDAPAPGAGRQYPPEHAVK